MNNGCDSTPAVKKKRKTCGVPKGSPLEYPPCQVCGGKGSGRHYGVCTCQSCKTFFRRYLKRDKPYTCSREGKCKVSSSSHGNCSACRVNRCLQVGMSVDGVKLGRCTLEERNKTIKVVNGIESENKANSRYQHLHAEISRAFEKHRSSFPEKAYHGLKVGNCQTQKEASSKPLTEQQPAERDKQDDEGHKSSPASDYDSNDLVFKLVKEAYDEMEGNTSRGDPLASNIRNDSNSVESLVAEQLISLSNQTRHTLSSQTPVCDSAIPSNTSAPDCPVQEDLCPLSPDNMEVLFRDLMEWTDLEFGYPDPPQQNLDSPQGNLDPQHRNMDPPQKAGKIGGCRSAIQDLMCGSFDISQEVDRCTADDICDGAIEDSLSCSSLPSLDSDKSDSGGLDDSAVQDLVDTFCCLRVQPHLTDEEIKAKLKEEHEKFSILTSVIGPMQPVSGEEYKEFFTTTGMDIDGRMAYWKKVSANISIFIKMMIRFAHKVPGFTDLSLRDQTSLIKGFRQDYHIMISNRGVDPDLEVAMLISGEVIHQNKGWMFGPTAEARKAWFALCRDIQRLLLTPEETALILGICLTYSDRCILEQPKVVDGMQTALLSQLRKRLREQHENKAEARFCKMMDMLVKLRTLAYQRDSYMKKAKQDEFVRKHCKNMNIFKILSPD